MRSAAVLSAMGWFILQTASANERCRWHEQKITADDAYSQDSFGTSVAIAGDTLVIGSPHDDDRGANSGSAYVFQKVGETWKQVAKLLAKDGAELDEFGERVAISGDFILVAAPSDDPCGSVHVYKRTDGAWAPDGKLTPEDGLRYIGFGEAIALAGNTIVVGASWDNVRDFASGSAYIFELADGAWRQTAKITADDGAYYDHFGSSVGILDGRILVSAEDDDDFGEDSGAVYVFEKLAEGWRQTGKLLPLDGTTFDRFGRSLAVSGNSVLVGSGDYRNYVFQLVDGAWIEAARLLGDRTWRGQSVGDFVAINGDSAFVGGGTGYPRTGPIIGYGRTDDGWSQSALFAEDYDSVALSADALVAGSKGDSDRGLGAGAAFVYTRGLPSECTGNERIAKIKCKALSALGKYKLTVVLRGGDGSALDTYTVALSGGPRRMGTLGANGSAKVVFWRNVDSVDGAATVTWCCGATEEMNYSWGHPPGWRARMELPGGTERYASSVAISGGTALVGSPHSRRDSLFGVGSVFVFEMLDGMWSRTANLWAQDWERGDYFGASVSVSGETLLVGSPSSEDYAGSAYVFGNVNGAWRETAKLTGVGGENPGLFGSSSFVCGDRMLIGAPVGFVSRPGSAYVFEKVDGAWTQIARLAASDGSGRDSFGCSVSLLGDTAVVGANTDSDFGASSGSAYAFQEIGATWTQVAKLTADDGVREQAFGSSVALSEDILLIGAPGKYAYSAGGAVYAFEKVEGSWKQTAKLTPDDSTRGDCFGFAVALSGNSALIGAFGKDSNREDSGAVYAFEKRDGAWTQVAEFTGGGLQKDARLGESVALDGDLGISGAPGITTRESYGEAFIFERQPD